MCRFKFHVVGVFKHVVITNWQLQVRAKVMFCVLCVIQ